MTPPCEIVEDRLVGDRQVGMGMLLAQVPAGLHGAERPRTRARTAASPGNPKGRRSARLVAPRVDRLDVDAFVGVRDELLLERRPFQVGLGQRPPLVVADRREVVAEGELGGDMDHGTCDLHFVMSTIRLGCRRFAQAR